jgi:Vault protein inter-alpha-trypsin domain/PEP-CTERM motif
LSQAITTNSKFNVGVPLLKEKILLAIFGILLPLIALIVELKLRVIARGYFDPFPSNGHAMLFALIPLSNAFVLISMSRIKNEHYAFLTLLNGMAAGIATTYALMFIPVMTVSFVWIFALGIGLLGFAPLISIFTTHRAGHIICELARKGSVNFEPDNTKHLGHLLVIATIIAVELPSTLTRIHLGMACEPSNASSINDLNWLRENGNKDVLLRACYERSGKATDILGTMFEASHPPNLNEVRNTFYKVTGKPFNSVPIPIDARATMQHAQITIDGKSVQDEFDLDTDIAGESVSSISRGLTMANESLNGKVEFNNAIARLQWSMEFNNTSKYKREARAKAILPAGAVVTGATFWRDGTAYQANISSRKVARRTYKRSLVKEDHPLLISTCGPDQILIQCYPISPFSLVKIELEIVAPLRIDSSVIGALELPKFFEQNFGTTGKRTGTLSGAAASENADSNGLILRDKHEYQFLPTGTDNACVIPCAIKLTEQQKNISVDGKTFHISQTIDHVQNNIPKHVIIIIDGSSPLNQVKSELFEALKQIPKEVDSQVFVITDAVSNEAPHKIQSGFEGANFVGGQDNSFFLYKTLSDITTKDDTAVLWIHGSQPVAKRAQAIKSLLVGADHPMLYDMQVCAGPNEVLDGIFSSRGLERVSKFGSVKNDLQELFSKLSHPGEELVVNRKIIEHELTPDETSKYTYDSADVLAVAEKIVKDVRSADYISDATQTDESLATTLHIVTPVTSAIVSCPAKLEKPIASAPQIPNLGQMIRERTRLAFEAQVYQLNNLSSAAAGFQPDLKPEARMSTAPNEWQSHRSPAFSKFATDKYGGTDASVGTALKKAGSPEAPGSLEGAQVDPMYGQSNEVGQTTAEETKPVPEPETLPLLLMAMGLLGVMLFVVRNRKKAFADG